MKTRYGVSPWIHQFPATRRPDYPRFRGELTADVVIMGGGLTGCATAQACAAAGMKVLLLERDRIGHGSTGRGAGLLLPDPGPSFRAVSAAIGLRAARHAFESWRRGSHEGAAMLRRLGIKCQLEPRQLVVAAGRGEEKEFRREYEAREAAGLDVSWLTSKQVNSALNLDAAVGVRMRDAFSLDPYRACVGLAAAAKRRGAKLFEQSPVTRLRFDRKTLDVIADGGTIRAGAVVIATGSATAEFRPLRRHFTRREIYHVLTAPVAAPVRKQLGALDTIRKDARVPPHRIRWTGDDRLVLAGADQDETATKLRSAVLLQRTGQLMYELLTMYPVISGLHPEYGWEASYGATADGLMYIGPHRNYPRHLFALGSPGDSVTGSFLSARILLRALQEKPDKADQAFSWVR
jgi:glycine/D-amino acid oxidase-like deaminating enzyme